MELSDKDKERIEQEAFKRYPDGEDIDLNWHYRTVFVSSAEYATIYEREKQAELRKALTLLVREVNGHMHYLIDDKNLHEALTRAKAALKLPLKIAMRNYGWDYKNHRSTSIIHNSMETKQTPGPTVVITTLKRTVTNGFIVRRGDPFNYDLVAICYTEENANELRDIIAQAPDLLAKVSEQEKEIERLNESLGSKVSFEYNKVVSEQSQRIQQLEGLLKDIEPLFRDKKQFYAPLYKKIEALLKSST